MNIGKSRFIVFLILLSLLCFNHIIWAQEQAEQGQEEQAVPAPPDAKDDEASQPTPIPKEEKPVESALILSEPVIAIPAMTEE